MKIKLIIGIILLSCSLAAVAKKSNVYGKKSYVSAKRSSVRAKKSRVRTKKPKVHAKKSYVKRPNAKKIKPRRVLVKKPVHKKRFDISQKRYQLLTKRPDFHAMKPAHSSSHDHSNVLGVALGARFLPLQDYIADHSLQNIELMYGKSVPYGLFIAGINVLEEHFHIDIGSEFYFYHDKGWTLTLSMAVLLGALPPTVVADNTGHHTAANTSSHHHELGVATGGEVGLAVKVKLAKFLSGVIGTKVEYYSAVVDFEDYYEKKLVQVIYIGFRANL